MAPVERRVKSINKPGDNRIAKSKKLKASVCSKQYSRASINKLLKKVLKRRANMNDSVHIIYKTYRRMIKMACELVARRYRKITIKDAHIAMARLIPRELAMNAIREFRQQPAVGTAGPSKETVTCSPGTLPSTSSISPIKLKPDVGV